MIGNPAAIGLFGEVMQGELREPIGLAQLREGGVTLVFARAWDGSGGLSDRVGPHATETLVGFTKQRIVEAAGGFQMGTQAFGLPGIDS